MKEIKHTPEEWVAFDSENYNFETFPTFEQAEKWLKEPYSEGLSEGAMEGKDWIAKVTHRSSFTRTDKKENYHEHTDQCPEGCDEEEWPYDNEWDEVGNIEFEEVAKATGYKEGV